MTRGQARTAANARAEGVLSSEPGVASFGVVTPMPVQAASASHRLWLGRLPWWVRDAGLHLLPYLLVGQTWLLAGWIFQRLFDPSAPLPELGNVAKIPARLLVFHTLVVAARVVPNSIRMQVLSVAAIAAGLGMRIFDPGSLGMFLVVIAAAYPVFRIRRIPLAAQLAGIFGLVVAARLAAQALGFEALARPDIAIGLTVCLWYACYECRANPSYGLQRHLGYLQIRLFTEGPVFSPADVKPDASISHADLRAIRTLAIAMIARTVSFYAERWLGTWNWQSADGAALWGASYVSYLQLSCNLVFSYNLALGVLQLAGLPIRDNFGNWFLARTPNEHWRNWNLLYREWILTFAFYPLMRRRMHLFLCVMAALLTSGGMHLFAQLGDKNLNLESASLTMVYWAINGLAIFLVLWIPRAFPRPVARLRLAESPVWWGIGWCLTSAFYAALFYVNHHCHSYAEVALYLGRLVN